MRSTVCPEMLAIFYKNDPWTNKLTNKTIHEYAVDLWLSSVIITACNATVYLHLICITFDRGERGPQVVQMMEEDFV